MSMNPDIAVGATRNGDGVITDPVFAALRKERDAFQAYSDSLARLARIGAFSNEVPSEWLLNEQVARLPELEAAETKASIALVEAEQELLATKPASIRGAVAMLGFLHEHLNEDPDIKPVREALANIQAFLKECDCRFEAGPIPGATDRLT